jgi:hypothetical protein
VSGNEDDFRFVGRDRRVERFLPEARFDAGRHRECEANGGRWRGRLLADVAKRGNSENRSDNAEHDRSDSHNRFRAG